MKKLTQETVELVKMLDNLIKVEFRVDKDYELGTPLVTGVSNIFLKTFCATTKRSLNDIAREMCEEICEASKEIQKKYIEKLSNMIFNELDKQYNRQEEV